jgi:hypothetical protein
VLHPNQFEVNEAWIAFKLNDAPIRTDMEGDFNLMALMDAASCFILGTSPVPVRVAEMTKMEARRLLKQGKAHKQQLPRTLFVPTTQPAQHLAFEAERIEITVVRIAEDQLLLFIGEAREAFQERFGTAGKQ